MKNGVVAIIPARGRSKGIPRKNLAPFGTKPLIAWTIDAALKSGMVDRVVVSTENEEIARVARECGAETPFLRPMELSGDETPSLDVVVHAVHWLEEKESCLPDWIVLLQPTSPLRTGEDIREALTIGKDRDAEAVVSVTPSHAHPQWMKKVGADGKLEDYLKNRTAPTRRQDLEKVFVLNGAIYAIRRDVLLARKTWFPDMVYPYIMPIERSVDVDTVWDLLVAELFMRERHGRG